MTEQKTKIVSTGIDVDRLINKESHRNFEELMKCKICFKILVNPHDCEICGNTFCFDCINNLKINKKPCPYNCQYFTIKPSSLGITSVLTGLKFYCLNKSNGCGDQIPYLQVPTHDKECKFSIANCPNVNCNKLIKRQLLEYHINTECEFSLFKCDYCQLDFNRNDYVEHVENCKLVSNLFNSKTAIINREKYEDIELKDVSIKGLMKFILFHLSKSRVDVEQKFEEIRAEVKGIKDEVNKYINENMLFAESINNELEMINEKITNSDFSNDNPRKMLDDNYRETIIIRDNNEVKNLSKDTSVSNIQKPNSSTNSTEIKSQFVNNTNKNTETNSGNVKKVTIRPLNKLSSTARTGSGNKSPTPGNKAMAKTPKARSPNRDNTIKGSPKSKPTYKIETENFHNRTNNIVLIKTMIKNQESIMEKLNNILQRIDTEENNFIQDNQEMRKFISGEIIDQIKENAVELSYIHSNMIIKKLDEVFKK